MLSGIMPLLPRRPHRHLADLAAAMTVARSARSSHSWHERDDRAERVICISHSMWVRAPFLLSSWPRRAKLAGEQCAPATVPLSDVTRAVEIFFAFPPIAFWSREKITPPVHVNDRACLPYDVVVTMCHRCDKQPVCKCPSLPGAELFFYAFSARSLTFKEISPRATSEQAGCGSSDPSCSLKQVQLMWMRGALLV